MPLQTPGLSLVCSSWLLLDNVERFEAGHPECVHVVVNKSPVHRRATNSIYTISSMLDPLFDRIWFEVDHVHQFLANEGQQT